MNKLVIVRHGESIWNKEKKFTGWTDVELTPLGEKQAQNAGKLLKRKGFNFDIAYTSVLKRATNTLSEILTQMNLYIPIIHNWRLNERHYGSLQGLSKPETAKEYGLEIVQKWRRDYNTPPPALEKNDTRNPAFDTKYEDIDKKLLPLTESLKDTINRVIPYFEKEIQPKIKEGKKIIISAHGNSLRALIYYLDNLTPKEVTELEIPVAEPIVYEFDDNGKPIKKYYLENIEKIRKMQKEYKKQSKWK